MFTPQQIQEIGFETALFGGYDKTSVDDVLEPLTEDYLTLYKENSVLKSKMRILVEKLEEYRKQEASMQNAIVATQKTCDHMLLEAEKKCTQMLHEAEENAARKAENLGFEAEAEEERLRLAKDASAGFIASMEKRLHRQLELLQELRNTELPELQSSREAAFGKPISEAQEEKKAFDFDKAPIPPSPEEKADALIEEIGQHIEESLGSELPQEESLKMSFTEAETPEPIKKKFEDLQFGKNYHIGK